MNMIWINRHIYNLYIKFLTRLSYNRLSHHPYIAHQHLTLYLGENTRWSVSSDTVCLSCLNLFDILNEDEVVK